MKNLDTKKIVIIVAVIIAVILVVFLGIKLLGNEKPTKEEQEKVEKLVVDYYANLTANYTTYYHGLDVLYSKDKTTYDTLDSKSIINIAIRYAKDHDIDTSVQSGILNELSKKENLGDIKNYSAYSLAGIQAAVKELFGKELKPESIESNNYLYDYIYVSEYEIYLVKRNSVVDNSDNNRKIDYKIVETTKKDDKITTTLAIAYVLKTDDTYTYAKDVNGENKVAEGVTEFPNDKVKEFDKYNFTLVKDGDNYILESIEKVK